MQVTTSADLTCAVCYEAAEESASAMCGECDQPFHLNQRNDVDGKDCGDVWVDEEHLSLRFACFNCLRRGVQSDGQPEPPVGEGH
jgi:hypothetical protein